ncbi:hypothetical protein JM49_29610 [Pseudomonas chlororaphis subsp. aurantiaca]|uniref:hypothetical protein n=1 Tax=Pseudomonas chlororaphis TaxID=587753 RepID=UPI00050D17E6|nr:hypothetical protein [Pseudomonas chlororaphis]AIS15694.1 hypothetical protein JM49_29610 [Pseudomonas chlororaphis subsp. aurantiaca]
MLINEILRDIRFRSFFMSGDLVCEFLVLFFKMSIAGWVSLTVSEGVSKFTVLNSEPGLLELSEISDDFAYPIRSLNGLDKYLGVEVLAVYEYRIKNVDEGCVGIYLDFGGYGLSIIESDECLSVVEGTMQYLNGEISLYKIEI